MQWIWPAHGRIKVLDTFLYLWSQKNKALFPFFVFCRLLFPNFDFLFNLCRLVIDLCRPLFPHRAQALCLVYPLVNPALDLPSLVLNNEVQPEVKVNLPLHPFKTEWDGTNLLTTRRWWTWSVRFEIRSDLARDRSGSLK